MSDKPNKHLAPNEIKYLELNKLIKSKRGLLLTKEYLNNLTKVEVKCENNHQFWITPKHLKRGQWCQDCYNNRRGLSKEKRSQYIKKIRQIVNNYSIELLSSSYINSDSPLVFRCLIYNTVFSDTGRLIRDRKIIKIKCTNCNPKKSKKDFYSEIRKMVEIKGGTILSDEYINSRIKVQNKCKNNHIWLITPNDLKNGYWCKKCHILEIQEKIRNEIGLIINSKGGTLKKIDFSLKASRVYIECEQHHRWWSRTTDVKQGKWCKKCILDNHIRVLTITHLFDSKGEAEVESDIKQGLSDKFISDAPTKCVSPKEIKYTNLKNLIKSKGGKLLSKEYNNDKTKVRVECKNGHRWSVTPSSITHAKTWCPKCHFETLSKEFTKLKIEDLRAYAKSKDGDCLEKKYLGWSNKHS